MSTMSKILLSEIWIYPVKSFGGISLHHSEVLIKGLRHDRRWMLIDYQNNFLTQREFPQMALFKMRYEENSFTVSYKGDLITLDPDAPTLSTGIRAKIWNDEVEVVEVSEFHSQWISERMGMQCKLVSFPEKNTRPVRPGFNVNKEDVSLADGFPYMIIGQASLEELNSRMSAGLPMNRFRPNFVFTGTPAFQEDSWKHIRIGNVDFAVMKPCERCVLTTVDQITGEKGKEPLATLSTFRNFDHKVLFGQNMVALNEGTIELNAEITLIK